VKHQRVTVGGLLGRGRERGRRGCSVNSVGLQGAAPPRERWLPPAGPDARVDPAVDLVFEMTDRFQADLDPAGKVAALFKSPDLRGAQADFLAGFSKANDPSRQYRSPSQDCNVSRWNVWAPVYAVKMSKLAAIYF
jgi:hypothetical protein